MQYRGIDFDTNNNINNNNNEEFSISTNAGVVAGTITNNWYLTLIKFKKIIDNAHLSVDNKINIGDVVDVGNNLYRVYSVNDRIEYKDVTLVRDEDVEFKISTHIPNNELNIKIIPELKRPSVESLLLNVKDFVFVEDHVDKLEVIQRTAYKEENIESTWTFKNIKFT